jgi:rhodanese-related sulfurtransferase
VDALHAKYEPSERLLFLCRSGVRSHYAAQLAAQAGFENTYNVLEGFEGEYGAGTNGWRAAGLPWEKGIISPR